MEYMEEGYELSAWHRIGYQLGTTNCGTCEYPEKDKWAEDKGECKKHAVTTFPIHRAGICRHHSRFRPTKK